MRRRPLEYALFLLGIALGVAMMVSIDLANGSASRAFGLSTDAVTGKTTHRIVGAAGGLDEAIYAQLRTELGYQLAAPVVEGFVSAETLGNVPLTLVGVDPFAEGPFRDYVSGETGLSDGVIAFLVQQDGILLPQSAADTYGVELNQAFALSAGGTEQQVTVVGFVDSDDELNQRGIADLIFTDISTAQELLGSVGQISHIDLIVEDEATLRQIEAFLPDGTRIETAAARSNTIEQMTAAFELNLTALSLLALVVGMFLIYNTVTFSVVQRRPLFGILRSLGVTGGQLTQLILAEAIVLGLIGSLVGLVLGVILGQGMVRLVTQTINDLYFVVNVRSVSIPASSLIKGLLIGVGAAILASLPPALEARGTQPTAILRRSVLENRVLKLVPRLALAAVAVGAIGALLLWLESGLVLALAGVFAVLFAAALITPGVTVTLMGALTPVGDRAIGIFGRMAPRNIVRSLSRTSVAIAALMTAVSVIIGVSVMVGSFRQTVVQWLDQTLQADIYVSPLGFSTGQLGTALDPDVVEQALAWDGISLGVTGRNVNVQVPEWDRSVLLVAGSNDTSRGERGYLWTDGDKSTIVDRLLAGEGIAISEPLYRKQQIAIPPEPITILTDEGEVTMPVIGIFYDYTTEQGMIWMGRPHYDTLFDDSGVSTLSLFVEDGADTDAIVTAMQQQFADTQALAIQSNDGLRQGSLEIFDRTFAITSALRLLATVVAFIGVLSALLSLQLEKARELGTLRATGMTARQLWQLTLLETGLMGSTAGLIAVPTGFILAWILIYIINLRSFGWTLQMFLQPSYFINAFLVALVAALLAGVYPAIRLGKMQIASALRSD